jgi:hypothetical protein
VKIEIDARVERELEEFGLVYTCERCAHFDPPTGGCASGYPNAEHREVPPPRRLLVFCKEFELA